MEHITTTAASQVFIYEECLKYFQKPEIVREVIPMFKQCLIQDRLGLNIAFKEKNWNKVSFFIDKILGGALYCGTPRLCQALRDTAPAVKGKVLLQPSLDKVNEEIDAVLAAISDVK